MDHPYASPLALHAVGQVVHQHLARLIDAQSMQVDLALQDPVTSAQPSHHVGTHARPAKRQVAVGIEQAIDVDLVTDRFGQGAELVLLELTGSRLDGHGRRIDTTGGRQRHGVADAVAKQVRLAFALLALAAGQRIGLRLAQRLIPKRVAKRREIGESGGETALWHRLGPRDRCEIRFSPAYPGFRASAAHPARPCIRCRHW